MKLVLIALLSFGVVATSVGCASLEKSQAKEEAASPRSGRLFDRQGRAPL